MKDFSDCRILIVDDAKANVDILVEALKKDYKLSIALNGEAALQIASKTPPDLVLLDIVMPGIDGYEVCRRLRRMPEMADVPIVFLSALDEAAQKARGFEAGANDYVTKPFEILEVQARVRSLLKAKAYSDAVKEKLASELRIAREIQMGILPEDVSAASQGSGLEVHAHLEPAREVGGDLFEVLRTENGQVVFALGDVSGKGIPAALFMAVTMTLIRTMARQFRRPDEIVRQVSDTLAAHNPRCMFVTILCGVYDPRTGRLTYSSAGHPPPVYIRDGQASFAPMNSGSVAGMMPGIEVPLQSLQLNPGETLVVYTDGVTEAFNAADEELGDERLLEQLTRKPGATPKESVTSVLELVRRHVGDHPPSDDIAVLALRRIT